MQCFQAVKAKLDCKLGYFDLIGCDFLIDEDFKVRHKRVFIGTGRMGMFVCVCVCLKSDRLNGVRHRRLVLELSTECAKTHYKHKVFIYLFCNLILFSFFKTIMIQFSNVGMILWNLDVQRPVVPLWSILNSIPAKQLPGNPCTVSVNMRSPGQTHTGLQVTRSLWIHT